MRAAAFALAFLAALCGSAGLGAHEAGAHEAGDHAAGAHSGGARDEGVERPAADDPLAGRFGGPFELVDQTGRPVTDRDFHGRFMLIYFGYTRCVDVCPIDLAVQGQAIDALGADADKVVSVFVTVDPARDTPAVLADWLQGFRPGTIGLTGSEAQVRAVAAAYRVHRRKVGLDNPEAAHLRETAGAYIVDHGTLAFLMKPDGRFATIIPHSLDAAKVTDILRRNLGLPGASDGGL